MNIGIVGLGLMGGSIGLTLKKYSNKYFIIGHDNNKIHMQEALILNLVDKIALTLDEIKKCSVIFLAIPVNQIISILKSLENINSETTVIDLGSTKEDIANSIPLSIRKNFIMAHPMTGKETSGPTSAIEDLYKNKIMIICDIENSGKIQKDISSKIFSDLELKTIFMNSKSHDEHLAFISHMPHIISFALANVILRQESPENIMQLAGGGFEDMSRLSKSSPKMWEDICLQNKANILKSILYLKEELIKSELMIKNEKWEKLNKWMTKANFLQKLI